MKLIYSQAIRQLGLLIHYVNDRKLEPYGVTMQQAGLLGAINRGIYDKREITRKYLAEISHLKGPTVTGILNNLEKKGLIIKGTSGDDARAVDISITEKGNNLLEELMQQLTGTEEELVQGLTDIEKNVLTDLLYKLQTNLSKYGDV